MILCCGEALIDMLPRLTDRGESAFAPHPGGAVFDTAVALGRLGARAGFYCGLSSDMFGAQLVAHLEASGVSTALCPRPDRPTTLAFVTLTDGQARYAFHDENTALRMLATNALPAIDGDVTALFFGGISLVSEPCGSAFEALALREAPARVVMLDPNIRPAFIRDQDAYRARLARMIAVSDILKLSDEDLSWLMPGQPEAVVDTVGAGDTFNAGFLTALARADVLERASLRRLLPKVIHAALTLATRVASVAAGRAGADPPHLQDLA